MWEEVEKCYNYLISKNVILNEALLFNQLTKVQEIVEEEINNNLEWHNKIASDKWVCVFSKMAKEFPEQYIDIFRMCEYLFSLPGHNANVERIFSLMSIQWTDERSKLLPETVEAILQCLVNLDQDCGEMYHYISKNKDIVKAAKSSNKY